MRTHSIKILPQFQVIYLRNIKDLSLRGEDKGEGGLSRMKLFTSFTLLSRPLQRPLRDKIIRELRVMPDSLNGEFGPEVRFLVAPVEPERRG